MPAAAFTIFAYFAISVRIIFRIPALCQVLRPTISRLGLHQAKTVRQGQNGIDTKRWEERAENWRDEAKPLGDADCRRGAPAGLAWRRRNLSTVLSGALPGGYTRQFIRPHWKPRSDKRRQSESSVRELQLRTPCAIAFLNRCGARLLFREAMEVPVEIRYDIVDFFFRELRNREYRCSPP